MNSQFFLLPACVLLVFCRPADAPPPTSTFLQTGDTLSYRVAMNVEINIPILGKIGIISQEIHKYLRLVIEDDSDSDVVGVWSIDSVQADIETAGALPEGFLGALKDDLLRAMEANERVGTSGRIRLAKHPGEQKFHNPTEDGAHPDSEFPGQEAMFPGLAKYMPLNIVAALRAPVDEFWSEKRSDTTLVLNYEMIHTQTNAIAVESISDSLDRHYALLGIGSDNADFISLSSRPVPLILKGSGSNNAHLKGDVHSGLIIEFKVKGRFDFDMGMPTSTPSASQVNYSFQGAIDLLRHAFITGAGSSR